MRFGSYFAAALLAAVVLVAVPEPAAAQSFFEKLFGLSSPNDARAPSAARRVAPPRPHIYDLGSQSRSGSMPSRTDQRAGIGQYRTMCVRMCDGYYFPISSSASRSRFRHDASMCRSQCGEDAQLFYHPRTAGSVDGMVDLRGRMYARLDIAFRYRKQLIDGCRCKPDPWAEAERARHQSYAGNGNEVAAVDGDIANEAGDQGATVQTESVVENTSTTNALPVVTAAPRPALRSSSKHETTAPHASKATPKAKPTPRPRKKPKSNNTAVTLPWLTNTQPKYRFPGD